jgi:hypothetical protein
MQRPAEQRHVATTNASPDPILGGTLALMSFYARTQHAGAAQKIARNLALLAQHPELSAQLQTICKRLFGDWVRAADMPAAERLVTVRADLHEEPPWMQ